MNLDSVQKSSYYLQNFDKLKLSRFSLFLNIDCLFSIEPYQFNLLWSGNLITLLLEFISFFAIYSIKMILCLTCSLQSVVGSPYPSEFLLISSPINCVRMSLSIFWTFNVQIGFSITLLRTSFIFYPANAWITEF